MLTFGAVVEVVGAEVLVDGSVFEHVVGGSEDGSGDRANGFLCSATRAQAQILRLEITVFGSARAFSEIV